MAGLAEVSPEQLVQGTTNWLSPSIATSIAAHPRDCVTQEYPHTAGQVDGSDATIRPQKDHPIFYGCYDWHSAVHSHWTLIRLLRLQDSFPEAPAIRRDIDDRLTPGAVATEASYLESNPHFERPYGWAWYLRLSAELALWDDAQASEWRSILQPLENQVLDLIRTEFLSMERPVRVGTHGNSAFALAAILDYATVTGASELEENAVSTANELYLQDTAAPLDYEPIGWDFLSPTLQEATLMARILDGNRFHQWFGAFLPNLREQPATVLPEPVAVPEDASGIDLHYVGLNISRAWMLTILARLTVDSTVREALQEHALTHAEAGVTRVMTEEYAGSHWLLSFLLYLGSHREGAIGPFLE